ncbi:glyoxal reductase-like [Arctopsyche grandis]|uniref:glyoxal reductase-like n=1 Tax=Arctopsyche grandis TaxID=121162 RepID=UPI00406D8A6E
MTSTLFKLNDGNELPLLGFGTYLITRQSEITRVCDEALKAGYRSFDTAAFYNNETELGLAFKKLLPKHNLTRKDIYITSKLWIDDHGGGAKTENAAKESLRKLQCEYLDLYLIHWPGAGGLAPSNPNNAVVRRQTWSTLVNLHKKGLLKSIGVSNYNIRHIKELVSDCDGVKPAVNQVEWHPHIYQPDLLEECRSHGILLQAFSPLGGTNTKAVLQDPVVNSIAEQLKVTPGRVLIRWIIQHKVAVIPKAASSKHIEENVQVDFVIPPNLMEELNKRPIHRKYDWDSDNIV